MVQLDDSAKKGLAALRRQAEENLMQSLAPQYGYEYINLHTYTINPEALVVISEAEARAGEIVIFDMLRKRLSIAIHSPNNPETQNILEKLQNAGYQTQVFLSSTSSLEHAYKRYQDQKYTTATKKGVLDIDADQINLKASNLTSIPEVNVALDNINIQNGPRKVSETLEMIFAGALALKASDIHIEPEEGAIRLRYRLDGVLIDVINLDNSMYSRLISRLKLLSGMILNQRREAQDGRFTFTFKDTEIEIRSSVIPGAEGESMVMRLLDPSVASFDMEKLNLNSQLYEVMKKQLTRPNGLIITTGPTGSGKTTALYAFLRQVHEPGKKIITIENPVEYKIEGIVQTQVSDDYTFSTGLRAILRQDPDIIMVGEIRDPEVAETAMHAAQTGHLVFTTLHTNNAVGGFPRLIDLGVDPRIIGSSVNVVLGQRLVRKLCNSCKQAYIADDREFNLVKSLASSHPEKIDVTAPLTLYKAGSCEICNFTGYKGRDGIFEAIIIDEAVEEVVIRDPREHIILEAARSQNIPTMQEDGITKVLAGITSLGELRRVVDLAGTSGATLKTDASVPPPITDDDISFKDHIV